MRHHLLFPPPDPICWTEAYAPVSRFLMSWKVNEVDIEQFVYYRHLEKVLYVLVFVHICVHRYTYIYIHILQMFPY